MRAGVFDLASRLPDPAIVPLAGVHRLAKRRYWRGVRRWKAFIARSERWSEEQLQAWQLERLIDLVRHAATNVPYYRSTLAAAGVTPDDLRELDDLHLFPVLDKTELRDHRDELLAENMLSSERVYFTTGGSTGIPVGFYQDRGQDALTGAFISALWERVGFRQGDRSVVLRGAVVRGDRLWELDPFRSQLVMSSYHLTDDRIPAYLERIRAFRPRFLQAYPSAATLLARYMLSHGERPLEGLAGALCGSENLYDWQREIIEDALGCRVYSWYGLSEGVCLAGECEHSARLHVFPQYGLAELLDATGTPITTPGLPGEIVATGLHGRVMPLLRYRTMDRAVLAAGTCPSCRRPYRQFERIEGRLQELIVTATGRLISMTAINMHSPVFDNVRQFRFVQEVAGHVVLRVVPAPAYRAELDGVQIRAELEPKLGDDMALELVLVDEISRSGSGKFHFLDQHLPLDVGDRA